MRFLIRSRQDIKKGLLPDDPFVWITYKDFDKTFQSLHDPKDRANCRITVSLCADDIIPGEHVTDYEHVFNRQHARHILDAYQMAKDQGIDIIVCQCEAGISRSAATAAALCQIDGQSDDWIYDDKSKHPNVYIKNEILKLWREMADAAADEEA